MLVSSPMNNLPPYLCQTEEFSCFGCCGHHFEGEKDVLQQVKENTNRFGSKISLPILQSESEVLSKSGICHSVINKGNKVMCGLHPMQNKGEDNRDKECEREYFCKTMHQWKMWDEEKKVNFLEFMKKKNPTVYEYSIKMDNDSWLEEFLK